MLRILAVKATNKVTKVTVKATKKQYISIVNSLYTKGTLPSYITVNGKKVGFNDYTVGLARILAFYSSNSRLPNYVTFTYKY